MTRQEHDSSSWQNPSTKDGKDLGETGNTEASQAKELPSGTSQLFLSGQASNDRGGFGPEGHRRRYENILGVCLKGIPSSMQS